jgi:hypothetical protein
VSEEEKRLHSDGDLWDNLRRLDSDVGELRVDVSSVKARLGGFADQLDKIEDATRKTPVNWGWMFSGVSLIIGIGALVVTGLTADITRIEKSVGSLTDSVYEHVRDGHPRRIEERVKRVADMVEGLAEQTRHNINTTNESLQREMGMLDEILNQRIQKLDAQSQLQHDAQERLINDFKQEQSRRTDRVYSVPRLLEKQ